MTPIIGGMSRTPDEVLLVGLGTVAQTHLDVLEAMREANVIGAVDPAPPPHPTFRGRELPVVATIEDAAALAPTLVVIATPTSTHAALCRRTRSVFPDAAILVEKPAADQATEAEKLLSDEGTIEVAYHMAFAPEVLWGERLVQTRRDELGPVQAAQAWFTDPYAADITTARRRFTSSWLDSGINSLSVLTRFCDLVEGLSLRPLGDTPGSMFEARIRCISDGEPFEALIVTSWHVTDSARRTWLRFASGAELLLDHHAVAGYLMEDGQVTDFFGTDGSVSRRESHYAALYRWLLVERCHLMSRQQNRLLHALLLQ
jgi:Predicted dehydrogenases and related proteins